MNVSDGAMSFETVTAGVSLTARLRRVDTDSINDGESTFRGVRNGFSVSASLSKSTNGATFAGEFVGGTFRIRFGTGVDDAGGLMLVDVAV